MDGPVTVLVVNTGGVTLDLSIISDGRRLASELVDPWDGHDTEPISRFVRDHPGLAAVGHRVVDGGEFDQPVVVDDRVLRSVAAAVDFSPVHQERALLGIGATRSVLPDAAHVACFDTTYHRTIPEYAATYALPAAWQRFPVRRRGFHGLSHQHVALVAPRIAATSHRRAPRRIVSCHLGSGASLCAILDGASIDTTMGATPLEGLVMAHRSGTVDPEIILWLIEHASLTAHDVAEGLSRRGGLAALAGGSGDMRDIVARRSDGDTDAALAFDVYIHRLRGAIGAMVAALDGIDILAFTGGVGEHMPAVRHATTTGLRHLGVRTSVETEPETFGDHDITAEGASVATVIVGTGEDVTIAAATLDVVDHGSR
jgi:acetate kinase